MILKQGLRREETKGYAALYSRRCCVRAAIYTRVLALLFIHVVIIYGYFVATPSPAKNLLFSIRIEIIVTFTL